MMTPNPLISLAQNNSGLRIAIHPLCLLNISDYYTRLKEQSRGSVARCVVLGRQNGREVVIENTFEMVLEGEALDKISQTYLDQKQEQFKQVFPALEIMGWFTCGSEPRSWEFTIQAQMKERYDSPLLVMLDPSEGATVSSGKNGADLPLTIYETTIEVSHASTETKTLFIEAYWKLETGESERIAVDHISKANTVTETGGADGDASLIAYLTAQSNAVRMLSTRVNLLRDYVEDVKCERTSGDHQILTQISALCQRLPAITGAPFKKEFDDERGDVMLLGHLAALTKGAKRLSDISDMYETIRKEMKSHAVFPTDTQRAWGYRSPPGLSDCK